MVHCKALALDPADRQMCGGRAVKLVCLVLCLSCAARWGVEEVDSMPGLGGDQLFNRRAGCVGHCTRPTYLLMVHAGLRSWIRGRWLISRHTVSQPPTKSCVGQ